MSVYVTGIRTVKASGSGAVIFSGREVLMNG